MGLAPRLNFGRDRLMECYFWAIGMTPFEAKFTNARMGLTKVASLITLIDDIYDVYGTLDELQLFTKAVERYFLRSLLLISFVKKKLLTIY
jgi:isoprene synthase